MGRALGNLRDDERCTRMVFDRDSEGVKLTTKHRCRNPKRVGLEICNVHAGKRQKELSEKQKLSNEMAKFGHAISANDPEADIVYGFEMEYRRTVGNIRYCQEQIDLIKRAQDIVWGKSKEERKDATEFRGTDKTFEARVNIWVELQMRERKHFLEMQKIWIGAKLDSKRLEINQQYVIMLDRAISASLNRLGLDSSDPEIRNVIRQELLQLNPGDDK